LTRLEDPRASAVAEEPEKLTTMSATAYATRHRLPSDHRDRTIKHLAACMCARCLTATLTATGANTHALPTHNGAVSIRTVIGTTQPKSYALPVKLVQVGVQQYITADPSQELD
jgi:hypothetical protein